MTNFNLNSDVDNIIHNIDILKRSHEFKFQTVNRYSWS